MNKREIVALLRRAQQNGASLFVDKGKLRYSTNDGNPLNEELLSDIQQCKADLVAFLEQENVEIQGGNELIKILDRSTVPKTPLSYSQERLWFIDKLQGSSNYHMPTVLRCKGVLNHDVLELAFRKLLKRHEVLRTVYNEENGQVLQLVINSSLWTLEICNIQEEDSFHSKIHSEVSRPFDLASDFPVRASLIRVNEHDHILIIVIHHICSDGWSQSIFINELTELYLSGLAGSETNFPLLPIQYADYASWQRNTLQGESLDRKLIYWENRLEGVAPLALPTDFHRPAIQSFRGASIVEIIDVEVLNRIKEFSREQGLTVFMTLISLFKILLSRYSGQQDICVGTPIANRIRKETEHLIGFFVNTLALRSTVNRSMILINFLQQEKVEMMNAYSHQDVPFEKVVERVEKTRDMSRSPLFQAMFILQNNVHASTKDLGDLVLSEVDFPHETSQFDLTFHLEETATGLKLGIEYCTDLFSEITVRRMAKHYRTILRSAITNSSAKIEALSILDEAEEFELLNSFNATTVEYDTQNVTSFIDYQAKLNPTKTALAVNGHSVTYGELRDQATQFANYITKQGVGPGVIVGVCFERSPQMVMTLLAILKAGGAYLPLDPSYPVSRLHYMLEDSKAKFVLGSTGTRSLFSNFEGTFIDLGDESILNEIDKSPLNFTSKGQSTDPAYLIYTSGSTGNPKGVVVSHKNVCNFFAGLNQHLGNQDTQRWLAVTSISFDISVLELFWTLSQGHEVIIQPDRPQVVVESPMDFSLFYFAAQNEIADNKYELLLEGSKFADMNHFSAVWVPERHFHSFGDQFPNPSVAAAAVAVLTSEIKIRSGSVVLPLHDTIRVAEEWAMVDNLSNGRVELSVASGWHPNDFVFAPEAYETRHQLMRQKLIELKNLWKGKPVQRTNGVGREIEVSVHPKPVQNELPIWITAAGGLQTFEYAGSIGANVLTHLLGQSEEELKDKIQAYRNALERNGFNPKLGKVALMLHTFISDDPEFVEQTVKEPFKNYLRHSVDLVRPLAEETGFDIETNLEDIVEMGFRKFFRTRGLFGTPESCISHIQKLYSLGVTEIACLIDFGIDTATVLKNMPFLSKLRKLILQLSAQQKYLSRRLDSDWSPGQMIHNFQITHMQCTPTFARELLQTEEGRGALSKLQVLLIGGEPIHEALKEQIFQYFNGSLFNMYGPTETTVWSTMQKLAPDKPVSIGKPIANTQVYILDDLLKLCPIGVVGEIYIGGDGVTSGYYNRDELTNQKFIANPFRKDSKLYRTGDLGRWKDSGDIECLGRIDTQVKIRGHRIELGEIENVILKSNTVDSVAVSVISDSSENTSLIAYVVPRKTSSLDNLSGYLKAILPLYMVPSSIILLPELPLTSNGKIDKKKLPRLSQQPKSSEFVAPRTETERLLSEVWSEILKVDKVSINDNFFELGGHSLIAIALISKIQEAFHVRVPLREIFKSQTIALIADFVTTASRIDYSSLKKATPKSYYELSSAQRRVYFVQQLYPDSISYNMPIIMRLSDDVSVANLERAFQALIERHEIFRTSFVRIEGMPMQKINERTDFKVDTFKADQVSARRVIEDYIRPFQLDRDILLRAGFISIDDRNFLIVDTHHIISDGVTGVIIEEDFLSLLNGVELPALKFQYKDFSEWQNQMLNDEWILRQEQYWLDKLSGELPKLNVFNDRQRPEIFTFSGATHQFVIDGDVTKAFKDFGASAGATLYMNMLALFNLLFFKYTGQEDIIIGTGVAGRPHVDVQRIAGMFVNTVAMRNNPKGNKRYVDFLAEVVDNSIASFENQDVPFDRIVEKLNLPRDPSRNNPVFDFNMVVQNFEGSSHDYRIVSTDIDEGSTTLYQNVSCKFDMNILVEEKAGQLIVTFEYYKDIFEAESICRMEIHFRNLLSSVLTNPQQHLKDIQMLTDVERKRLIFDFNDTATDYPKNVSIHELFFEQVKNNPELPAVVYNDIALSYGDLDEKSTEVANYLLKICHLNRGDVVGVYMSKHPDLIVAILGILKAGGAYFPISNTYPETRIVELVKDSCTRVIIGEKKQVKRLNRLQWQCEQLKYILFLDTFNILNESEEKSELNNIQLWEYVGRESIDDVTGGGWNSSYTGFPISQEEMDEYGNNVLLKLRPFLTSDTRVLEIGCASGITMFRVAPIVSRYYGTDLSGTILQKNEERIQREGHTSIVQKQLAAIDIDQIDERDFDIVIINSVIQCFDGHNYLLNVIRKVLGLMKPSGILFMGDIMDEELRGTLQTEFENFKLHNSSFGFKTKTDWSQELFLSRNFWKDLRYIFSGVHEIDFSHKIGKLENELTKYRYDVIIHIDQEYQINLVEERTKFQHDLRDLQRLTIDDRFITTSANDLAYVMYTSGSTGNPKGVMATHRNVVRLVKLNQYVDFSNTRRLLQTGAIEFDASTFEIWGSLLNGLTLYLADKEKLLLPSKLQRIVQDHQIDIMWLTSSFFNKIVDEEIAVFSSLKFLIVGGEALSYKHINLVREKFPLLNIVNGYGPTENVTFSTTFNIKQLHFDSIPIGKPISNSTAYVLSPSLELLPQGALGELYVGGDGVSRGYMNNVELTAERFIENPHRPNEIIYKTGDLVRWSGDGYLKYHGRGDGQIKIRGYRVELSEIENVFLASNYVAQCVVIAHSNENGDKRLIAYVVPKGFFDRDSVVQHIKDRLPDHMVPPTIIELDSLPLTVNGKIDKSLLPNPQDGLSQAVTTFANDSEAKLAEIWARVLGVPMDIELDSNFFDMGGHSLLAIRLVLDVRSVFDVELDIDDVFTKPTLKALANFISQQGRGDFLPAITRGNRPDRIPLSFSQERLWFIDSLQGTLNYHMPTIIRLVGDIDTKALQHAFQAMINRHEVLRTTFSIDSDGMPLQVIGAKDTWNLTITNKFEGMQMEDCVHLFADEFNLPFDLSSDSVIRVTVGKVSATESVMIIVFHHIAFDGWSQSIFIKEFAGFYNAFKLQKDSSLLPLPIQYADYALWQRHHLEGNVLNNKLFYWDNKLSGIQPLNLPTDFARPPIQGSGGDSTHFVLDQTLSAQIQKFANENGATMYMVLLATFNVLLSRYSGQTDICVGTPTAGRTQKEIEGLVGFFVNTIALRSDLSRNPTFAELLQQVKTTTLEAYKNQDAPFEKVVERVERSRDLSRSPIFQVMFVLQNVPEASNVHFEGVEFLPVNVGRGTAQFDLTLYAEQNSSGISFSIEYSTDLFLKETIERMGAHFQCLIRSVISASSTRIDSLEMLTAEEKTMLVDKFNATSVSYPAGKTLLDLFYTQASLTPDGIAVRYEDRSISYRELDEKSNQLSHYLLKAGVRTESLVGICIERSIEMIIGLFGILKSGGAYVPVDPEYPVDRIEYMLSDSQVSLVLTSEKEWSLVKGTGADVIRLDSDWSLIEAEPVEGCGIRVSDSDLAYVIYTSGSTGRPKGVMITHGNVYEFLMWSRQEFSQSNFEIVYGVTSICFDLSVFEIFYTLTTGRPLKLMSSLDISKHLSQDKNILLNTVPSVIGSLLEEDLRTVTVINMAGEPIPPRVVEGLDLDRIEVRNLYGPSEDTTYSSRYRVREKSKVFIGRPISNTSMYILDGRLNLLPIGVSGELYISGKGLSRGYLNQPELTSTRFIANPFIAGQMLYKTGDLCRWLLDGDIEYLGRIDDQVKIRGYRIELGEIETVLQQYGGVSQSVVLAKSDSTGGKRLVGYVVKEGDLDREDLQNHLRKYLPDYMIPSAFVRMDSFPLTSNGKIDKRTLPDPQIAIEKFVNPSTLTEQVIQEIWSTNLTLSLKKIGLHDNFFSLGGHSLLAGKVAAALRKKIGASITVKDIFNYPTIFELASFIDRTMENAENEVNPIDLHSESILTTDFTGIKQLQKYSEVPSHVFLTGATGFVGVYVLHDLLNSTDATIHCLTRGQSEKDALTRIKRQLKQYRLDASDQLHRIVPVLGDLAVSNLGMKPKAYEKLSSIIDIIYHVGADVNFNLPFAKLKAVNVDGNREMVKFAITGKLKKIIYVSTLSIFSGHKEGLRSESDSIDHEVHRHEDGYASSKWVGEKIILRAREKGVPVQIHRLGLITGDKILGRAPSSQWFSKILRTCIEISAYTDDYQIAATPVDYVSRSIVELSLSEKYVGRIFHLTNPRLVPLGLLFTQSTDAKFSNVTLPEFLKIARERSTSMELSIQSIIDINSDAISSIIDGKIPRSELINRLQWSCNETLKTLEEDLNILFPDMETHCRNYLSCVTTTIGYEYSGQPSI